ncbi:MAG: Mur ligase family protein [Acidimicrobiia bacterium]
MTEHRATMHIGDALQWLDAHVNLEAGASAERRVAAPTLDRIESLTTLLGSPQLEYPAVHLTGTNGKTSVARMTTELLLAAGLSVGSYTSPHLQRVNERMAWNGSPIDDDSLAGLLTTLATVEQHVAERPSFFELLTAAALEWFADVAVDVGVVEVGLGGRWDATNVVRGDVAVVTNVSIDHVEYLGPTREQIAAEKAGIVKPGSILVLGETDPALAALFDDPDAARTVRRGVDFGVGSQRLAMGGRVVDLFTPSASYTDVFLPLHGAHQADNAAIALAAAEAFAGVALSPELVVEAFAAVRSPGRLEVVGHQPLVLLDGAHNVAGCQALRRALAEEFAESPRTLVIGLLREKEPHEMLEAVDVAAAERVICCRPPSPRALDPAEVAAAARDLGVPSDRVDVVDAVPDAIARALAVTAEDGQIVVTGSLYVVGAARQVLGAY